MSMQTNIVASLAAVLSGLLCFDAPVAYGGLVFSINGSEGVVNLGTLTTGSPSQLLTVGVRRDDLDSGGTHIVSFGFSLRSTNGSVAAFTGAAIANPGGVTGSATSNGATASASGTFNTPLLVNFAAPGTYQTLATFTLEGFSTGSASIIIDELTLGNNDFRLSGLSGADPVGQDRIGFSGDGTVIGSANYTDFPTVPVATSAIVASSITAVPEPSSLLLLGGVLGGLACKRFRKTKRKEQ